MADSVSTYELMSSLDFTFEDLKANQQGFFSEKQRIKLKRQPQHITRKKLLFVVIIASTVLTLIYIFNSLAQSKSSMVLPGILGFTCVGLYFIVAAVGSIVSLQRSREAILADLREGLACSIVGRIEGRVYSKQHPRLHSGLMSRGRGLMTDLPPVLYTPPITLNYASNSLVAFRQNQPYRIYFAPNSKFILSAESISEFVNTVPATKSNTNP